MLDKVIHKHIDNMDRIEDTFNKELDKIYNALDIDDILNNPESVLIDFVNYVGGRIEEVYSYQAVKEGLRLSDTLKRLNRDVVIVDTDDQNINEDVVTSLEKS